MNTCRLIQLLSLYLYISLVSTSCMVIEHRDVTNDMTAIEEDMTAIEEDMTAIEEDMTAIEEDMTAIEEDMTVIEEDMTAIEEDMTVGSCGNSRIDGDEVCDDGNTEEEDYCSSDCLTVTGSCGDGVLQSNERCDPEVVDPLLVCSADCIVLVECGNGVIEGVERCDGEPWCTTECQDTRPCASSTSACPILEFERLQGGIFYQGIQPIEGQSALPAETIFVEINSFYLQKAEVSVAQYRTCVLAGECTAPLLNGTYCRDSCDEDDHPVNGVTWEQAQTFAHWLGGDLPSEAAWEYAAQGGVEGRYPFPWGNETISCEYAVYNSICTDEERRIQPVCSKPNGHSYQGLCDMIGNVSEWVADHYDETLTNHPVDGSPWIDPEATNSRNRVHKGGAYNTPASENLLRIYGRGSWSQRSGSQLVGFRVMLSVAEE